MLNRIKRYTKDSLYKNSIFLILTNFINSILGFIYWILAARLYLAKDVGLATAMISSMNLLALFSRLGFGVGLIRFLPQEDKKTEMINSCLTLSFLVAICLSIFYIFIIDYITPSLKVIKSSIIILIIFVLSVSFSSIIEIIGSIYIAFRRAEYSFLQSLIWMGLKAILITFFTSFGAYGIFSSWGISVIIGVFISILIFVPKMLINYKYIPKFKIQLIKKIIYFSFGNYIAVLFQMLPQLLLPLIILNMLGAEMAAYFYIAWMIAFLLFSISTATGFSFLAETSYYEYELKQNIFKSIKFIFTVLSPTVVIIFFFGEEILYLFGEGYSKIAYSLLKLLVISSIFVALNTIYVNIERIKKKVRKIIYIYMSISLFTIVYSYLLIPKQGLIGVGIAWLLANLIVSITVVIPKLIKLYRSF